MIRHRVLQVVGILATAVPFAFGLIRAISTRHDLRYLWIAVVAFFGASVIVAMAQARSRQPNVGALITTAVVIDTVLSAAAGYALGARSTGGVWLVAFCFALCSVTGVSLIALSRTRAV